MNSLPFGVIINVIQPRFIILRVIGKLIPIGTCSGKITSYRKQKISFTNFRKYPVDLLFAVTYHKLQGVTLDKLILSINQPLRGRLHKAAARPQRRGERLGALKFKEIHPSAGPRRRQNSP